MQGIFIASRNFQLPLERLSILDPEYISKKLSSHLSPHKKVAAGDLSKLLLLTALELATEPPKDFALDSSPREPVIVKIAGRPLPVASDDLSTQEIVSAAKRVDEEAVRLAKEFNTQDSIQIALLTAVSILNRSERRGERAGDDLDALTKSLDLPKNALVSLPRTKTIGPILLFGRITSLDQAGGTLENQIGKIPFTLQLEPGSEPLVSGADAELYGHLKVTPAKLEFSASRVRPITSPTS